MNWLIRLVNTSMKPLLYIKSFYGLKVFFHEQLTSFRIITNLYSFYPKIPPIIYIEPTNYCNISCISCPSKRSSRTKGYMDFNLFKKIIDEASQIGVKKIHLYNQGEPLLHPNIVEMIDYIKHKHINLLLVTNGMLLDKEKSEAIFQTDVNKDDIFIVSILGYSKEIHEKVMNGVDHEKVMQNIFTFIELRKKRGKKGPIFKGVFGELPENKSEKEQFLRYWSNILDGIAVQLLSESFRYYKQKKPKNHPRKHTCAMLWERMIICWNGDVTICPIDFDGDYILGNVKEKSITEIWNSQKLLSIKKLHAEKKFNDIPLCSNCDMK